MSSISDETAGSTAHAAGDRRRLRGSAGPPLLVIEPARQGQRNGERVWWYVKPVELMFTSFAPRCDRCGRRIEWVGPPARLTDHTGPVERKRWVYRVACACPAADASCTYSDEIEVDWPLRCYADAF